MAEGAKGMSEQGIPPPRRRAAAVRAARGAQCTQAQTDHAAGWEHPQSMRITHRCGIG